jgi:hypothetical protein
LLAIVLALTLDLGRCAAVDTRFNEESSRKEQMSTIRDDLFVLASLLLGFTLALASPRDRQYTRKVAIIETEIIGTHRDFENQFFRAATRFSCRSIVSFNELM